MKFVNVSKAQFDAEIEKRKTNTSSGIHDGSCGQVHKYFWEDKTGLTFAEYFKSGKVEDFRLADHLVKEAK